MSYKPPFDKEYYARLKSTRGPERQAVIDAAQRVLQQTKAKKSRTLVADTTGSTAFSDLTYEDGAVFATFTDGTEEIYEMSRAEAKEWFEDDSLGGYFNAEIR